MKEEFVNLKEAGARSGIEIKITENNYVNGYPTALKIVVHNLLSNAWKFIKNTDRPIIEFGTKHDSKFPTYFVRDNRADFDMNNSHKLYQPYSRIHNQDDFEGNGIGLSTVQRIFVKHVVWKTCQNLYCLV